MVRSTAIAALLAAAALPVRAAAAGGGHAEILSVDVDPGEARVGDVVTIRLRVRVQEEWHIYPAGVRQDLGQPTSFTFADAPLAVRGSIGEPAPRTIGGGDQRQQVIEGEIEFRIPVAVTDAARPGPYTFTGTMSYLTCQENGLCIPEELPFEFDLAILEGRAAPTPTPTPAPTSGGPDTTFLGFLLGCVVGGLVSLIMPCVYPLIPITITYFVKQGAGNRARSALLAYAYAAGIIVTFTALGLVLALALGRAGGQIFSSNPWVNLAIAALFFAFALSLFGAFEIRLPWFVQQAASGQPRGGVGGAFLLGLAFAVITFTCTIPIAATLLGVAAAGNYAWAVPGMAAYSITMAAPFLLLGLFPDLIAAVPKGGGWLHESKIAAGFLELALAVKYLANVDFAWGWEWLSRDLGIIVWTVTMGFTALYLLGLFRWKEDVPVGQVGIPRAMVAAAFAGLALSFYSGIGSRPLGFLEIVLPYDEVVENGGPRNSSGDGGEAYGWIDDFQEGLERAAQEGRPVIVDFTGFS